MTRRSRTLGRLGLSFFICICLACAGCERSEEQGRRTGDAQETLHTVELPALDGFTQSVQEQLRSQHALLQELASGRSDPASLGETYGVMGQLLLAYDLNHAAEPALLNAARLLPQDFRWPYYLGHLYRADAALERAARQFERALALQPRDVPTHLALAGVYRDMGREDDAEALLRDVLRIDPESATAHQLLGQLAGPDQPQEAIDHYEAVLRLQPEASVVRYPLALAYQKLGDLERSREHLALRGQTGARMRNPLLEDLERMRAGPGALIFLGNRLQTDGRYAEAAALFEQAIGEDSTTNVTAYLNLAGAVAQLGDFQKAMEALEEVLRLDPENSSALYNLGVLFDGKGQEAEALERFRAAVEADPRNDAARLALANLLWRRQGCQEAVTHFTAFLAVNPGNIEARMSQAVCHARLGEYARTRELLEEGLDAAPQERILQDAMIRVLAASPDASVRDGERALRMAGRLTAEFPRPETIESLAMAYAELGRFNEAVQYQRQVIGAAEGRVPPQMLHYLQSNLERYERGEPCRTPWPPTVFDR